MEEAGVYFNLDGLKPDSSDVNSLIDANEMARQEAQGYSNTAKFQGELKGDNATYRLLEWITHYKGKLVLVTLVLAQTSTKKNGIPVPFVIVNNVFYVIS